MLVLCMNMNNMFLHLLFLEQESKAARLESEHDVRHRTDIARREGGNSTTQKEEERERHQPEG